MEWINCLDFLTLLTLSPVSGNKVQKRKWSKTKRRHWAWNDSLFGPDCDLARNLLVMVTGFNKTYNFWGEHIGPKLKWECDNERRLTESWREYREYDSGSKSRELQQAGSSSKNCCFIKGVWFIWENTFSNGRFFTQKSIQHICSVQTCH